MPHIGQPRKYVKIFKLIHFNKSKIERETQREIEGGDIENPFEMQPAWILPHWPVGNRNICTKAGPEKETTELAQLSSAQLSMDLDMDMDCIHIRLAGWRNSVTDLCKFGA